ncbi:MAG TPA: translocation/assembly module TamB domain-containing protein [Kofleriaceae bacterium]|nr:translocation/assembly module TamB domain-containing protein [Kofleriaceae bacterium]
MSSKSSRKALRWTKRIVLGVLAFVVVAVGVVLGVLHTDWGRDLARAQIEARMNAAFIGGAKIGSMEGSVLGDLVLRDVVLNGPDKKPAITIKKLTLGVPILPLFSKQARVKDLHAEDVDIDLRRDPDGTLQVSRMVKPSGESSGFSVMIPELLVSRAHVRLAGANGAEDMNLDNIHISGDVAMPADEPLEANVLVMAQWRERGAPIWVDTNLRNDAELVTVPSLIARVGDVRVSGAGIRFVKPQQASLANVRPTQPVFSGVVTIDATKTAVQQLAPNAKLPVDDIDLVIMAAPVPLQPWTHVTIAGKIDQEQVLVDVDADIEARHVRGLVATGNLNLTKLSGGKLEGQGTAVISFDGVMGKDPNVLPIGQAMIHAGGDIAGTPNALATIAITSTGEHAATAIIANAPGASAQIGAKVKKLGESLTLEASHVVASVRDPSKASGGKAPLRGNININVAASGALQPKPDLSVTGRMIGTKLRAKDVSIRSLDVAIAASHLPSRPIGKAEVRARDLQRGTTYLRELDINAANREDGKIAVTMRSRPRTTPWLAEVDALVTPGETITIDLARHRIRVGNGSEWRGTTGQIVIGPTRIDIRDLASKSSDAALAVAGHMHRKSGDLKAHVALDSFGLENISKAYRGNIAAKIDVERVKGKMSGVVDIDATGISIDPRTIAFDADARIEAGADKLLVDAKVTSPRLGTVDLDVNIDAPDDIANVAHWKKLHRENIRSARLQLIALDVGRIASLAKVQGEYGGRIDGDIVMSPTSTGGLVQLRELSGPALKNLGPLTANLTVKQTGPDELTPTFIATIDDRNVAGATVQKPLAQLELQAALGIPDHLFDPAAWQKLGKAAFKGGSLRVEDVMIEPPLLDRMQITTNMRGRASFVAELAPAMESAKAKIELRQLRGNPIERPVSVDFVAQIDNAATTATMQLISSAPTPATLLDLKARIPVTFEQLMANPQAFKTAKLTATATLPDVSAPRLLQTFGRTQITDGRLSGTIEVTGTVGKPLVHARIAGTHLDVPPGPRGRPIKRIDRLALDAKWDGTTGNVTLDATQKDGMMQLLANGSPKDLGAATVSLKAKQFDLLPLLAFAPGPAGGAAGRLDADLTVKGLDPRRAKIAGELHLSNARLPINPNVGTLNRAKVDVTIGDVVKVAVDGRLGGGTVKASATLGMNGAMPTGGDAKIELREVSPIGVVEPDIDADVTAKLTRRNDAWVADIVIDKAKVEVPEGRGEKLDPVGMPEDMRYIVAGKKQLAKDDPKGDPKAMGEETRPVAPTFIANITLKPTFIESNELRGYIRGNIRIEREAAALGIVGKIEADRGDLDLFGRRYQLDRAVVRFDGSTDPLLDIVITHDFPEVTTTTQVRGRVSKPELVMRSDPGTFSQGQLLGFLLGGEPEGAPADGNPRDKAVGAGASFVANKIGGYVKDALPIDIDVLRYEAATSSSGAAITVGTWVSRSLFVAYRRRIEARPDENAGEGEIEYYITRRVVIEGVVGDRGFNGVDLLWRRRY